MATLVAKKPPVGVQPGLKLLHDQEVSAKQPECCLMSTAMYIHCGSGFQTY
jgi:hypothetical protein